MGDDAIRLKRRLAALPDSPSSVVIVGGGYVGTELACTLSKIVPTTTKLTILHRNATSICNLAETYNQESASDRLDALGVDVKLGVSQINFTTIPNDESLFSSDKVSYINVNGEEESVQADILIWAVAGASNDRKEMVRGLP